MTTTIEKECFIHATPAKVFQALTEKTARSSHRLARNRLQRNACPNRGIDAIYERITTLPSA